MIEGGNYEQFNIVLNISNTPSIRRNFQQQERALKKNTVSTRTVFTWL